MAAEFNTPSQEKPALSSVFMTPSSSCGRPIFYHPKALLTPPPFSIPSPLHTPLPSPPPASEEHKDILTHLFEAGVPLVAQKVLSMLDQDDISNCLRVCKFWRTHISRWHNLIRIPSPQESLTDENSITHSVKSSSTRAPLALINNASVSQNPPKKTKITATHGTLKFRPCPRCQSPAKRLNIRRSECAKCLFDFCEHCFCSWHEGSCGGRKTPTSPKKSESQVIVAGNKKAKKRLKRL